MFKWDQLVKVVLCEILFIHKYKIVHESSSKVTKECVRCGHIKYEVIIYGNKN